MLASVLGEEENSPMEPGVSALLNTEVTISLSGVRLTLDALWDSGAQMCVISETTALILTRQRRESWEKLQ